MAAECARDVLLEKGYIVEIVPPRRGVSAGQYRFSDQMPISAHNHNTPLFPFCGAFCCGGLAMTPDLTTIHLACAMDLLASTRVLVSTTDWGNPAHVAAASEGLEVCLGAVTAMLDELADELGCREAVAQQVEAETQRAYALIAQHEGSSSIAGRNQPGPVRRGC
ncbi:hypothetical protein F8A10_20910 (plasmid) [Paracoccus kondratievae]|uniref:hypothetical protein n=1 Tax=Paracoccus kondratievae TaxID=135740 RepID=UPI00126647F1|nr:hypothetical protein [Paracoccus kondratievae]QFQ89879.1 hypothetical protein F8A10_20910 [Paracoccus kondratievae]